ncbi:MAG: collagen-binding domain-containing protein [Aliishimia sp.]
MRLTYLIAAATIGFSGPAFSASLTVQETLGTFNLVTETYTGNQEVEGRTYIDGDLTSVSGQFGFVSPSDGQDIAALSVNGDLINSNINLTTTTQARVSGSVIGSRVNNGTVEQNVSTLPDVSFASYLLESQYLSTLTGVSANVSDQNNKVFGGAQIVDVALSDLSTGGYSFNFGTEDFLIINVSGTTGSFGMNPLGSTVSAASNVLWNFFEATNVQVNSVISGHILAPNAVLSGFNGSSEGTVIAKSVNLTNGELHQQTWTGLIPVETTTPVPLPAGLPMLLAGLGVFGFMRRLTA